MWRKKKGRIDTEDWNENMDKLIKQDKEKEIEKLEIPGKKKDWKWPASAAWLQVQNVSRNSTPIQT